MSKFAGPVHLPLWLGGGVMFQPLAITIIFGLIFATALTLGVVPILYSILFRVRFKDFVYRGSGVSSDPQVSQ